MGKARSIKLDTRTFNKVGDARAFFSAMLNRYKVGDTVAPSDEQDLRALLKRHSERDEKIGPGIAHFIVDNAPDGYPGKCFWIAWIDGRKIDFSFQDCLEKKPYD